jgi:hypothetical protein
MPTNRTPIERQRHVRFSAEILDLFVELERWPGGRDRSSREYMAKSKRLSHLLNLNGEWWAGEDVHEEFKPSWRPALPLVGHWFWEECRQRRLELLAACGLQEKEPA